MKNYCEMISKEFVKLNDRNIEKRMKALKSKMI